jgi:hypothetical protein
MGCRTASHSCFLKLCLTNWFNFGTPTAAAAALAAPWPPQATSCLNAQQTQQQHQNQQQQRRRRQQQQHSPHLGGPKQGVNLGLLEGVLLLLDLQASRWQAARRQAARWQ